MLFLILMGIHKILNKSINGKIYIIDNASECFTRVFGKQWIDKNINGFLMNSYMNWVDISGSLPEKLNELVYIFIFWDIKQTVF